MYKDSSKSLVKGNLAIACFYVYGLVKHSYTKTQITDLCATSKI